MATRSSESPARRRVLETAAALFYAEGVHRVGVDRIIAESGVAKATFYHHFPAKDELVRAYLEAEYRRQKTATEDVVQAATGGPREALLAFFDYLGENGAGPGFRGCPFTNAGAEYPDRAHPVRQTIADYRHWNRSLFRDLVSAAGGPDPEHTATILMMIRDGIVVGSDLDDPAALRPAIRDAVTRVLDGRHAS
jgi:AcrR family transcriptional regulator